MITTITLWLQHTWVNFADVMHHEWLFYLIAVPVVGVVTWAWSHAIEHPDLSNEDDEASYW